MLRGGMEIQVNVVDRYILLKAQEEPDKYQDLVVRIAEYSDYFVKLSRETQSEAIMRTEHDFYKDLSYWQDRTGGSSSVIEPNSL